MVWFFDRGGERLRYEIRRAAGRDAYVVAVTYPDGETRSEEMPDAAELLDRCGALARELLEAGWEACV